MTYIRNAASAVFLTVSLLGCSQNKTPDSPSHISAAVKEAPSVVTDRQNISVAAQIESCRKNRERTLSLDTATASDLQRVGELTDLEVLEIYECDFNIADLEQLNGFAKLKRLRLEDLAVTDTSVNVMSKLSELEILNLPASSISDQGFQKLISHLPKLILLRIGGARLSDGGIAALGNLPKLRFLHLVNVPITDTGLQTFHEMHELESLYIDGDNATDEGIRDLLKANPKLHFHRNQTHFAEDPNADGH